MRYTVNVPSALCEAQLPTAASRYFPVAIRSSKASGKCDSSASCQRMMNSGRRLSTETGKP